MQSKSTVLQEFKRAMSVWKTLKSNWVIALSEKFVFILVALPIVLLVWQWKHLPPLVPLWYDKAWGAEQLADPHWLFILPIASFIIYILNVVLSIYVVSEYLVFTQMASLSALLVSLLSAITLIKILFLVR